MTLVHNNGTTKELDPKVKLINPWVGILGILLSFASCFNVYQSLKINLLQKQIKALESLNRLYESGPAKEIKPKTNIKDFVKVLPKVKPKEIAKVKEVIKPIYKEYKPLIANNATLLFKINEIQESINSLLNREFGEIYLAEGERLINHEKLLISQLNSDLSILLDVQPPLKQAQFLATPITKTKFQRFKKIAIPIAFSVLMRVVIP